MTTMPVIFPELDALIRECEEPLSRPEQDPREVARLAAYHMQNRAERLAAMRRRHAANRPEQLRRMKERRRKV